MININSNYDNDLDESILGDIFYHARIDLSKNFLNPYLLKMRILIINDLSLLRWR